jgi:hypothetical protein
MVIAVRRIKIGATTISKLRKVRSLGKKKPFSYGGARCFESDRYVEESNAAV